MTGTVYLVGAGPSDAGLFTLKGMALLEKADVVVHDALIGPEVMALIPQTARRINVGKHAGNHTVPQKEINQILLREARAGNRVVRLKGGDPFLFGRGGEELELLVENGIPFEVVPGVTSAVAVPAYAGIPVTHRDYCSSVHIITAHTQQASSSSIDYEALVRLDGTLVFLMGVAALDAICDGLLAAGMVPSMPAAIVERGTTSRQRRVAGTVSDLSRRARDASISTPAIIVVGRVCALADHFSWAEKRPLAGKRIVVTRPRERASAMTASLRNLGAEVVELPTVTPVLIEPNPALDAALNSRYDWLALTSPTGTNFLIEHLRRIHFDIRRLYNVKLAAVGAATADQMKSFGLIPELVPKTYSAAALGEALARQEGRILIIRAREGAPELTQALRTARKEFTDIALYDTQLVAGDANWLLDGREIDYIAFTSASTVHGFMKRAKSCCGLAVCIGQATERAARSYGFKTVTAKEATIASMTERMIALSKEGC